MVLASSPTPAITPATTHSQSAPVRSARSTTNSTAAQARSENVVVLSR